MFQGSSEIKNNLRETPEAEKRERERRKRGRPDLAACRYTRRNRDRRYFNKSHDGALARSYARNSHAGVRFISTMWTSVVRFSALLKIVTNCLRSTMKINRSSKHSAEGYREYKPRNVYGVLGLPTSIPLATVTTVMRPRRTRIFSDVPRQH